MGSPLIKTNRGQALMETVLIILPFILFLFFAVKVYELIGMKFKHDYILPKLPLPQLQIEKSKDLLFFDHKGVKRNAQAFLDSGWDKTFENKAKSEKTMLLKKEDKWLLITPQMGIYL
jgi:hypothetical protein